MKTILRENNTVFGALDEDNNWVYSFKGAPIGWVFGAEGLDLFPRSIYSSKGKFLGYLNGDRFYNVRLEIKKIDMIESIPPVLNTEKLEELERAKKVEGIKYE